MLAGQCVHEKGGGGEKQCRNSSPTYNADDDTTNVEKRVSASSTAADVVEAANCARMASNSGVGTYAVGADVPDAAAACGGATVAYQG